MLSSESQDVYKRQSWDWEHLILAEKPCEDPEYAGVGRSAVAYVDGSYQHALGKFSCGVVLFLDGKELNLAEDYSDPDLVSMRNVAGEIKGAELAMAYCLTHDIPELAIYQDVYKRQVRMYDETIFSWDGIKPEYHARKGEKHGKEKLLCGKTGKGSGHLPDIGLSLIHI